MLRLENAVVPRVTRRIAPVRALVLLGKPAFEVRETHVLSLDRWRVGVRVERERRVCVAELVGHQGDVMSRLQGEGGGGMPVRVEAERSDQTDIT